MEIHGWLKIGETEHPVILYEVFCVDREPSSCDRMVSFLRRYLAVWSLVKSLMTP
jgi:hypothetical protein